MRLTILILSATLLTACGSPSTPPEPETPSAIILRTCSVTQQIHLDSGETARMRAAMAEINSCLEDKILELAVTQMTMAESVRIIEKSLNLFRSGYQRLYFEIYNSNKNCVPTCGSINQLEHIVNYQAELTKIIDIMLAQPEATPDF